MNIFSLFRHQKLKWLKVLGNNNKMMKRVFFCITKENALYSRHSFDITCKEHSTQKCAYVSKKTLPLLFSYIFLVDSSTIKVYSTFFFNINPRYVYAYSQHLVSRSSTYTYLRKRISGERTNEIWVNQTPII